MQVNKSVLTEIRHASEWMPIVKGAKAFSNSGPLPGLSPSLTRATHLQANA
jgi:hypothetical protein